MPDIGFRYARADLLKALADRRGVGLSNLLRSLADAALASEGFPVGEQQYALVSRIGEIITTGFRIGPDDRGTWLPIENEDTESFDPAKHWRLKPLALRLDGDRVVRTYPVVEKSGALA